MFWAKFDCPEQRSETDQIACTSHYDDLDCNLLEINYQLKY